MAVEFTWRDGEDPRGGPRAAFIGSSSPEQLDTMRIMDDVRYAPHAELVLDGRQVVRDGAHVQVQLGGDLGHGLTLDDEREDLMLA